MTAVALDATRMLIDGELVESSSGAVFDNLDPASEEVIGHTADGTADDMHRALAAARRAFDETTWSTDLAFRRHCLTQLHDSLQKHKDVIRPLLITECGTAAWVTRDTLLDVPIDRIADYAALAEDFEYETELPTLDFRGAVSRRVQRHEAIGVVSAITPWNGPWGVNLMKIAPALAAGNTVVLKPSPEAPWAATILGRLVHDETDIPPGVLNVVTAQDDLLGEILTTDPRVDMVTFTGSAPNGRRIAAAAAPTLKRLVLELGGKSAHIVLDDADVAAEAALAARTICANAGQGCVARSRLLVPRARYAEAVAAAIESMRTVVVGDPADPRTFMGPLISARQRDRVLGYIETARAEGAHIAFGGGRPAHLPRGHYVEPTLITGVYRHSTIAQEEVFGPVLAVIAYDDDDDAISIANDSVYGLSASVASASDERALAVAARLRVGTCNVNGGQWMHMDTPFGGYKQSGVGREFGVAGYLEYLETKVLGIPLRGATATSTPW